MSPGPSLDGCRKYRPLWDMILSGLAYSELLYHLRYPGLQSNESAQFRPDCIYRVYLTHLESSVPGCTSEDKGNGDLARQQVITSKVVPRCS